MAARARAQRRQPEIQVIDLSSDDSDDSDSVTPVTPPRRVRRQSGPLAFDNNGDLSPIDEQQFFDALLSPRLVPRPNAAPELAPGPAPGPAPGGQIINIGGEDVFIPDEEPPVRAGAPAVPPTATSHDNDVAMVLSDAPFTAHTCLQRVLEIFPDISHEHVTKLYNDFDANSDYEDLPGPARLDNIIEQLVSGTSYPKQEKGKQPAKKRKREDSIDEGDLKKWEGPDREIVPHFLKGSMQAMLKAEFQEIPIQFINDTLAAQKHFYQAYIALAEAKDNKTRSFGKGRPSNRHLANADTMATNCGWPALADELTAARKRVEIIRAQRAVEDVKKKAEEENLQRAMERGETAECQACFDDLPMNRQIHCDGAVAHFTCYECAENYIKSEVGESRCRVLCTAGCGAGFAPNQLNLLSDKQLLGKLAELEQEKAIRDAGLDDLEECPFCDYKAILPPVEEDFEFRCANPECEKVSCRRCKSVSHIPISCEQHAKDNKVNSRHKIEEAMTAAMIRSCNKCKKQFIKEYGCNKMTCPSCANLQCYVCSESLKNYDHFDQAPGRTTGGGTGKKCPLYDNVEERHEREVKEAEAAARAAVVAENPDVSPEDLDIKVSDAVKKSTADKIKKGGGADGGGFGGVAFPMAYMAGIPGLGPGRAAMLPALFDGENDAEDEDEGLFAAFGEARLPHAARQAMQNVRARRARVVREREAAVPRVAPRPPIAPHGVPPQAQPAMQGFIPVYGFPGGPPPPGVQPGHWGNNQPLAPPPPPAAPNAPAANRYADYFGPFGNLFGGDGALDDDLARLGGLEPEQPVVNLVDQANDLVMRFGAGRAQRAQPPPVPRQHLGGLPGGFPADAQPAFGAPARHDAFAGHHLRRNIEQPVPPPRQRYDQLEQQRRQRRERQERVQEMARGIRGRSRDWDEAPYF